MITEETMVHERLMEFLRGGGVDCRLLEHPACRSSVESAAARAAAGAPGSVGAKALLLKVDSPPGFVMAVLPGSARLANDVVRRLLGKFRFAKPEEIAEVTLGLSPGMIPPFGAPVFPAVGRVIVDEQIVREPVIGFNAAMFERSIIMTGGDYVALVPMAEIIKMSDCEI